MEPTERSRLILDMQHELGIIQDRLGKLEDMVDTQLTDLAQAVHRLAVKVEALEQARDA